MQVVGATGVIDGVVDGVVKFGVKHFAHLWRNDGYLDQKDTGPRPKRLDPVILVNGFSVYNEVLGAAERSMRRDGLQVFTPELPNNGMGRIEDTAAFLAEYVAKVLRETGAKKVDLVGFSLGGLIARSYIKHHGGSRLVDDSISMASPHNGVLDSRIGAFIQKFGLLKKAVPEAAQDMLAGSDYLTKLNAGDPTPRGVNWYSIHSKTFDGIVWPGTSPVLEGAKNLRLTEDDWFPGADGPHHLGLQRSHEGYRIVRDILFDRI